MDGQRFDHLAKMLARSASRREALGALAGAAAGAAAGVVALASAFGASAKDCKRPGKKCDEVHPCCEGVCRPDTGVCCTPTKTACQPGECGSFSTGCGGTVECGCVLPAVCVDGACCAPDCAGKGCGDDDGCGGACTGCPTCQSCDAINGLCVPVATGTASPTGRCCGDECTPATATCCVAPGEPARTCSDGRPCCNFGRNCCERGDTCCQAREPDNSGGFRETWTCCAPGYKCCVGRTFFGAPVVSCCVDVPHVVCVSDGGCALVS